MRFMNELELMAVSGGIDNAPPAPQYPWEDRDALERQIEQLQDLIEERNRRNGLPLR